MNPLSGIPVVGCLTHGITICRHPHTLGATWAHSFIRSPIRDRTNAFSLGAGRCCSVGELFELADG